MGSTTKELVEDLHTKVPSADRERILERAQSGFYHDFDSPLATPKIQLDSDLRAAGYADLADRVRAGDYDDEPPTSEQREELARLLTEEK